jgi:hypothetical protein
LQSPLGQPSTGSNESSWCTIDGLHMIRDKWKPVPLHCLTRAFFRVGRSQKHWALTSIGWIIGGRILMMEEESGMRTLPVIHI